jgi:hypothetical protein
LLYPEGGGDWRRTLAYGAAILFVAAAYFAFAGVLTVALGFGFGAAALLAARFGRG